MAESAVSSDLNNSNLSLTPEEKRVFRHLFQQADTEGLGVVTGEIAVKFFERTKLAPAILGEIWQIADTENRGLLTPSGFAMVLRLIGHYQAGREPSPELAFRPSPIPKFEGITLPPAPSAPPAAPQAAIQPQHSGQGPVRVPALSPEKVMEYSRLFDQSGARNGFLGGEAAKSIFEKARLPNEVLGRVWMLADTEQKGTLNVTQFVIAMHLLASLKSGSMRMLPQILPPGLWEAASRKGPIPASPSAVPRQFTGPPQQRTQSPLSRQYVAPPPGPPPAQQAANDWAVTPQEKSRFDGHFASLDTEGRGYITGGQAVAFFSNSALPDDVLAQIWDLADINSEGQLNRDEFAVAMHLIWQQRARGGELPSALPPSLIPPSMRGQVRPPPKTTAPEFDSAANPPTKPPSAIDDLFGLDAMSDPSQGRAASPPQQVPQPTGGSAAGPQSRDPFATGQPSSPIPSSPAQSFHATPQAGSTHFRPFQPTSAFGQGIAPQFTGGSDGSAAVKARAVPSVQSAQPAQVKAPEDLLGDNDAETSRRMTEDTAELGNMSNQVGTLRSQMQEVQNKKNAISSELSTTAQQKRELETRLAQFRQQYDQEVKTVKSLEEKLNASRSSTQKLRQELAMLEGTHQDLQAQHHQAAQQLQSEQQENSSLKDRIRQLNEEINQLRPQLEKMRGDARQQRGMVAINKKQLATNEGERDKTRSEMGELENEMQSLQAQAREAETETARGRAAPAQPTPQVRSPGVTSPMSSMMRTTNPFFNRSPPIPTENTTSPPGFSKQSPSNFDNLFGPSTASVVPPTMVSGPPPTSFASQSRPDFPAVASEQSVRSSDPQASSDVHTPSTSPPASTSDNTPPQASEPPPPPVSGQITSNALPFREPLSRDDSISSSTKVSLPGSRFDMSGTDTPKESGVSPMPGRGLALEKLDTDETETADPSATDRTDPTNSNLGRRGEAPIADAARDLTRQRNQVEEEGMSQQDDIPGAFPSEDGSPVQDTPTGGSTQSERSKTSETTSTKQADPFSVAGDRSQAVTATNDDFDSAFAGFDGMKSSAPASAASSKSAKGKEFPDIQEFGDDEESDSDEDKGFDDDFTQATPRKETRELPASASTGAMLRPQFDTRDSSVSQSTQLPTPDAQKPPPTYDDAISPQGERHSSNQFPAEYDGLLPSRDIDESTIDSPEQVRSPIVATPKATVEQNQAPFGSTGTGATLEPVGTDTNNRNDPFTSFDGASAAAAPRVIEKVEPAQTKQAASGFDDDFDSAFADLDEAQVEKGDNDDFAFAAGRRNEGFDDFNPSFESPTSTYAGTANTFAAEQPAVAPLGTSTQVGGSSSSISRKGAPFGQSEDSTFESFGPSQSFAAKSSNSTGANAAQSPVAMAHHDWDAIFSGMDGQSATATGSSQQQDSYQPLAFQPFTPTSSTLPQQQRQQPSPFTNQPQHQAGQQSITIPSTHQPASTVTSPTSFRSPPPPPSAFLSQPQQQEQQRQSQQRQATSDDLPPLGRALSSGTEHDDPILKRLTGMGYERSKALAALERFDYNLDKAADYLATNS